MQITRTSMLTGITRTMDLPITDEQYARWQHGPTAEGPPDWWMNSTSNA